MISWDISKLSIYIKSLITAAWPQMREIRLYQLGHMTWHYNREIRSYQLGHVLH